MVVAQRSSTRLMTERLWVQIPLGAGLFFLFSFFISLSLSLHLSISSVSLIRSLTEVQHYWFSWKKIDAVQLEAKHSKVSWWAAKSHLDLKGVFRFYFALLRRSSSPNGCEFFKEQRINPLFVWLIFSLLTSLGKSKKTWHKFELELS